MRHAALLLALTLLAPPARAEDPEIELEHRAQLWLMSTFGARVDPADGGAFADVAPRPDLFVRRGRIRLAAEFPHELEFLVQLQYDGLAQDTGTLFQTSGRGPVDVQVRDAYGSWDIVDDRLELTAGFFHPKYSREAEVSAFSLLPFEKSDLQSYVRDHVVGQSSGRAAGLQLDGIVPFGALQFTGTLGAFDPNHPSNSGPGLEWSPLLVGRAELTRGAEEAAQNPWKRKDGLTVGVNGTWQPRTSVFDQNATFGGDLSFRLGGFAFATEAHALLREDTELSIDRVLLARVAWAFPLGERFIQPVVTFTHYDGDPDSPVSGEQTSVEAAVFALLAQKFRVGLALNWVDGTAPSLFSDGSSFRRGSWIALGVQHAM